MEKRSKADLKINGSGSSGGGKFNKVNVMGEGKISGDVDCINLKIYGHGELDGNLKAADTADIKGEAKVKGSLEAKNVEIQGEIEVSSDFFADEAKIAGIIRVGGDCNAEIFTFEGGFTIDGLLNADILKISLYEPCKVHEIGGSEITVKKYSKSISFLNRFTPKNKELTADVIEGDDIYLENTRAKVVRGDNVTIGSDCKIELVEYKDSFKQDEKSEVGTHKKV